MDEFHEISNIYDKIMKWGGVTNSKGIEELPKVARLILEDMSDLFIKRLSVEVKDRKGYDVRAIFIMNYAAFQFKQRMDELLEQVIMGYMKDSIKDKEKAQKEADEFIKKILETHSKE